METAMDSYLRIIGDTEATPNMIKKAFKKAQREYKEQGGELK